MDEKKRYIKVCSYCGKTVIFTHGYKPVKCPHCKSEDWVKPKTEQELFLLQRDYLESRDNEILGKMYVILSPYATSMIKKMMKGKKKLSIDFLEEKAIDAVTLILEQYLSKPAFRIEKSFAGLLNKKIKQVLYNKEERNESDHESLNDFVDDEGREIIDAYEVKSIFKMLGEDEIFKFEGQELITNTINFITVFLEYIRVQQGVYAALLMTLVIRNIIEGYNVDRKDRFYSRFGNLYKGYGEKLEILVQDIIRGR